LTECVGLWFSRGKQGTNMELLSPGAAAAAVGREARPQGGAQSWHAQGKHRGRVLRSSSREQPKRRVPQKRRAVPVCTAAVRL
jgi:hypothetical protein